MMYGTLKMIVIAIRKISVVPMCITVSTVFLEWKRYHNYVTLCNWHNAFCGFVKI